jgi:hypothetical protein
LLCCSPSRGCERLRSAVDNLAADERQASRAISTAASQGFWLGAARLNADKGLDLVFGGRTTLDVFLNVP